jgi:hypothetical protein
LEEQVQAVLDTPKSLQPDLQATKSQHLFGTHGLQRKVPMNPLQVVSSMVS